MRLTSDNGENKLVVLNNDSIQYNLFNIDNKVMKKDICTI
jgi:hypothetical protein